jgi:DtxR family transcriptional regulator, Mn-dependent transcriptional regulator
MGSFTEENYLKAIYHLAARQPGEVSTNALAKSTATKAASVTEMLRKLADRELNIRVCGSPPRVSVRRCG